MKLLRSLGKKLIPTVTDSRLHYGDVSIPLSNPAALAALPGRVWRLQRMTLLSLQGTLTLHPQLPNMKQELLLLKLQPQPVLSFCQTVTFSVCLFSIRYLRHGRWDRTSLLRGRGCARPLSTVAPQHCCCPLPACADSLNSIRACFFGGLRPSIAWRPCLHPCCFHA